MEKFMLKETRSIDEKIAIQITDLMIICTYKTTTKSSAKNQCGKKLLKF